MVYLAGKEVEVLQERSMMSRVKYTGDEDHKAFDVPNDRLTRKELRAPTQDEMTEWTDPKTAQVHEADETFLKAYDFVIPGEENAKRADELLTLIGVEVTENNKRHLRQAMMFARSQGKFVLSSRSSKGGYYLATTDEEVTDFVTTQKKLAVSMIRQADALALAWKNHKAIAGGE